MTFAIEWLPEAADDLERVYEFLAEKNPDAAARAVQSIYEATTTLEENPQRCPRLTTNPQRRKLRVFFGKRGYSVHFQIEDTTVYILQIYQGREDRPQ